MTNRSLAPLTLLSVLALAAFSLGQVTASAQEGTATLQPPQEPAAQAPAAPHLTGPWEYEVVGLTEIYGSTLDYLKGALDREEGEGLGGILGFGKKVDDQLVSKTRDLLNEYGADGWELVEYRENVLVFKRPKAE